MGTCRSSILLCFHAHKCTTIISAVHLFLNISSCTTIRICPTSVGENRISGRWLWTSRKYSTSMDIYLHICHYSGLKWTLWNRMMGKKLPTAATGWIYLPRLPVGFTYRWSDLPTAAIGWIYVSPWTSRVSQTSPPAATLTRLSVVLSLRHPHLTHTLHHITDTIRDDPIRDDPIRASSIYCARLSDVCVCPVYTRVWRSAITRSCISCSL